jgi:hypothetical protein
MARTPRQGQRRRSRARPRIKPAWERGYLSHGLWLGKTRVGVVKLAKDGPGDTRYRWEAGTLAGAAATLKEAKRAVEEAVLMGTMQLPLFDPPQRA